MIGLAPEPIAPFKAPLELPQSESVEVGDVVKVGKAFTFTNVLAVFVQPFKSVPVTVNVVFVVGDTVAVGVD